LVFLLHVCSAEASKKAQQSYAHAREARNKYDLTTSPFNHLIGPGGLLLVVPTYMQLLFQFHGWG